jgi:anti-sigma-K factor RskA
MKLQGRTLEQVAAAYALGTLSRGACRRFESLLMRDITARRAWQQWEERLSRLTPDIPPVRPPDNGWPTIEKHLEQRPSPRGRARIPWLLAAALVVGVAFVLVWTKIRS